MSATELVPITFLVIVGTVSVYGLLAAPLARRLGLADPNPQGILFGRAHVYELPPTRTTKGRRAPSAAHMRGRTLFGEELHHDRLAHWLSQGGVVKKTQLTDAFTPEDFRRRYGPSAVVLFVIHEDRRLHVCTAGDAPKLRPGQTVIALVDPPPATEPAGFTAAAG